MFVERMIRAAKLDINLYEEVEKDTTATTQAMLVVMLSSVASGIGMGAKGIFWGMIGSLAGWVIWAGLSYIIGTTLFRGPETQTDIGELLRTIGFSASPGILRVFGIIYPLRQLIFFVTGIWLLIAMVIAVRQALDFTTWRAIGTCIVGWIVQLIIISIILGMVR